MPARDAAAEQDLIEDTPAEQVPDLLWVESVSERLLGGAAGPRPWEETFFAPDEDVRHARPAAPSRDDLAGRPGPNRPVSEGDGDWTHEPAPGDPVVRRTPQGRTVLDLTAPGEPGDTGDRALRLALRDPDHPLSNVVLALLADRAEDRARQQRLRSAVEALLAQAPPAQAALLRRLLGD